MTTLSIHPRRDNADFQLLARSFISEKGLPLANVPPAAEIERIFRRHDAIFGVTYNSVYNTAIVLWAFLSQVLADGKMRSCATGVARGKHCFCEAVAHFGNPHFRRRWSSLSRMRFSPCVSPSTWLSVKNPTDAEGGFLHGKSCLLMDQDTLSNHCGRTSARQVVMPKGLR